MGMEDIMKALMQSAGQSQGQASPERGLGGDLLSGVLGGLMGGGQQGAAAQPGGGADLLSGVLGGLMGGGAQGTPQQMMPQQPAGGDMLGMLGSLMGGAQQPMQQQPMQQPQSSGDMMLGMLEQVIGGQPGQGQQLGISPMSSMNMGAMNNPIMGLLQPIVGQVAAKLNISPQIATVVASIAMHYLLSSHSSTSPQAPMNLGSVMQQLGRSGSLSQSTLRNSGMVNDVMQATGLNKQAAVGSLDEVFKMLGSQVQGAAG